MNDNFYSVAELEAKADEILDLAMACTFDSDSNSGNGGIRQACAYLHATGTQDCPNEVPDPGDVDEDFIREYYRGLTDVIKLQTRPVPRKIEHLVEDLNDTLHTMGFPGYTEFRVEGYEEGSQTAAMESPGLHGLIGDAAFVLENWQGAFATNLRSYFTDLEIVQQNLGRAVGVLAATAEAIRQVNVGKRKTMSSIVDKTVHALEDLRFGYDDILGDSSYKHALWAAGQLTSLMGLADPEPLTKSVLTITGVAISAATEFMVERDGNDLMAARPAHVLAKMRQAIDDMHDTYDADVAAIDEHLDLVHNFIEERSFMDPIGSSMSNWFVVQEPAINEITVLDPQSAKLAAYDGMRPD